MNRFVVPALGFAVVLGLATLLIGVVVLRSPDTHGNLWERVKPGYARTELARLGGAAPVAIPGDGVKPGNARSDLSTLGNGAATGASSDATSSEIRPVRADLHKAEDLSTAEAGRQLYLRAGCSTCHGLDARGAIVGTSLAGADPDIVKNVVRKGPGGMPAFTAAELSDGDLVKIAAYFRSLGTNKPSAEKLAKLSQLTYDPSLPRDVLLKGKAALRRSCGACHETPSKAEMSGGFDVGSLLASMVRETNLSFEDAQLIGNYILAIREGVDPVKVP